MLQLPESRTSFWRSSASPTSYHALQKDLKVDTVIVGGGLAGLTAAYLLKQAGQRVAVIEKGTVGGGTSGHTTGKITSQHGLIYHELEKQHGRSVTKRYGQANQAAIALIQRISTDEHIDCDWRPADNYVYTADPNQTAAFKAEAKAAQRLGLPASFETTTDLPFPVTAAVKFSGQATFHVQRYLRGLARAIQGTGSHIFEHSRAIHFRDGDSCHVKTKEGSVTAKDVIVATNVPTLPLAARGTYCALEYPHTSYIVAGPYSGKLRSMYISPDKAHYSILPVQHGKQRLLLIGGENHIRGWGNSRHCQQKLADYAERHFGLTEITYRWQAWDYIAYDQIPLAGRLYPWSKHLWVASAFKKWGLTNTAVAAQVLRDHILPKPNDLSDIYNPHRPKIIRSIPHLVAKALH